MTRLGLLLISIVVGVVLAVGASFTVASVVNSSNESPVNQPLYNYGTR